MKFELAPGKVLAGLALIPLALLSEALILQHLQSQAPCPLCILDRVAFLLYALIAIAGAIHRPAPRAAALYVGGMGLAALAGLGVAGWHVWTLHHPKFGCGIDVMEQFVNDLPTARLLPDPKSNVPEFIVIPLVTDSANSSGNCRSQAADTVRLFGDQLVSPGTTSLPTWATDIVSRRIWRSGK
jgi:disulfide bond formation protein DsbB